MSKFTKNLVKFTVASAAVCGLCYAFKDKIKESKVYQDYDVDEKINKVKTTIKEKMPKMFDNEENIVEEDEIFFDSEDAAQDSADRSYVSIDSDGTETVPDKTADEGSTDSEEDSTEAEDSSDIPTIEA